MKAMKPSVRGASLSILLAMAMAATVRTQDSDEFCCDARPQCKNVSTLDITLKQFVESSPHYELILSYDDYTANYEGVCVTYFPLDEAGKLYLEFRVVTKASGISVTVLLVSSLGPGFFREQGLFQSQANYTSVHNVYVVDASCKSGQPLYIYYKCYIYDTCDYVYTEFDDLNGRSSSPDIAPSCLDAFETLVKNAGLNVRGFTRPPGNSYSCVARYLNSTCLNYDKIAPNHMISYPPGDGATSCN